MDFASGWMAAEELEDGPLQSASLHANGLESDRGN